MVRTAKVEAGINRMPQTSPKLTEETYVTIKDNGCGDIVQTINLMKEKLGNINNICGMIAGYKVCHFAKAIHHNKNGIMSMLSMWEAQYEICRSK